MLYSITACCQPLSRETSICVNVLVKTTLSHGALLWLQSLLKKVPSSFELASQKKGYRRYMSPPLRELVAAHAAAQEVREAALSGILQVSAHLLRGLLRAHKLCCTAGGQLRQASCWCGILVSFL